MFGAIVLKDIPKEEVKIDIFKYQISGGFRGFFLIPFGLHHVSVKFQNQFKGFWFYIKPYTAFVKQFNYETKVFEDVDQETFTTFRHLALSGQMGASLINYPIAEWVKWNDLVSKIREEDFLSFQNESIEIYTKEYDENIENLKNDNSKRFFANFQFWFVSWFVKDIELKKKIHLIIG